MIRLAWALAAEDSPELPIVSEMLAAEELVGVDWSAATGEAALESGRKLSEANIPIVSLATSVTLPAHLSSASAWLDPVRVWVMAAAELGAARLRLTFNHATSTRYRPSAVRFADQLAALSELAGQQGVRILLETRGEFADPSSLWRILELSDSPNLSACLLLAEQTPDTERLEKSKFAANAISTLNLRIRYVHIQAIARASNVDNHDQKLSVGSDVSPFFMRGAAIAIHHLRGIGFDGCIAMAAQQDRLREMAAALRKLIQPPAAKPAVALKK